jgi:uncharacterized damage-inducible protein DinB
MSRPLPEDCAVFYQYYINLTQPEAATALPSYYRKEISDFFRTLPAEKASYSYAPGKWTLQQLLQHLIDVERVFVYRLLWIVREGAEPLPGFDENNFANNATAVSRSVSDLCEEWLALRESTDRFIARLDRPALLKKGIANHSSISANALCFIIYGHILHHMGIIRERYLSTM